PGGGDGCGSACCGPSTSPDGDGELLRRWRYVPTGPADERGVVASRQEEVQAPRTSLQIPPCGPGQVRAVSGRAGCGRATPPRRSGAGCSSRDGRPAEAVSRAGAVGRGWDGSAVTDGCRGNWDR